MVEEPHRGPFSWRRGLLGRLAGPGMVRTDADMARVAADLLALRGDERVLEIGFGPGIGIAELANRLPRGYVCGVDPSRAMLRQAMTHNREAVRSGRVDLRLGTAEELPWLDGFFDAVCSIDNVMLWEPLGSGMREIRRVLGPEGRLVIAVHEGAGGGPHGTPSRQLEDEVGAAAAAAGLPALALRREPARGGTGLYWS